MGPASFAVFLPLVLFACAPAILDASSTLPLTSGAGARTWGVLQQCSVPDSGGCSTGSVFFCNILRTRGGSDAGAVIEENTEVAVTDAVDRRGDHADPEEPAIGLEADGAVPSARTDRGRRGRGARSTSRGKSRGSSCTNEAVDSEAPPPAMDEQHNTVVQAVSDEDTAAVDENTAAVHEMDRTGDDDDAPPPPPVEEPDVRNGTDYEPKDLPPRQPEDDEDPYGYEDGGRGGERAPSRSRFDNASPDRGRRQVSRAEHDDSGVSAGGGGAGDSRTGTDFREQDARENPDWKDAYRNHKDRTYRDEVGGSKEDIGYTDERREPAPPYDARGGRGGRGGSYQSSRGAYQRELPRDFDRPRDSYHGGSGSGRGDAPRDEGDSRFGGGGGGARDPVDRSGPLAFDRRVGGGRGLESADDYYDKDAPWDDRRAPPFSRHDSRASYDAPRMEDDYYGDRDRFDRRDGDRGERGNDYQYSSYSDRGMPGDREGLRFGGGRGGGDDDQYYNTPPGRNPSLPRGDSRYPDPRFD